MKFTDYWKLQNSEIDHTDFFLKSANKLSRRELKQIQETISKLQEKNLPSSKIIKYLQDMNKKLTEKYKAERAFWTESKRIETTTVKEAGQELDVEKFRVILSPNACELCREKTQSGRKIFKSTDLKKSGYGHTPPFHPNCYCILVPEAD